MSIFSRLKNAVAAFRAEGDLIGLSDPRILELFGMVDNDTGEVVTPATAMKHTAVYACTSLISGIIAGLPLRFYKSRPRWREEIEDHPYWWLFNESPHPAWTSHAAWELAAKSMLLRGDGFKGMLFNRAGELREVIPFHPDQVDVKRDEGTGDLTYLTHDGYRARGFQSSDMLHLPGFGFSGVRSMSVLQHAASRAAGTGLAAERFAARFFRNGIAANVVIEAPGRMNQDKVDQLRQLIIERQSGSSNAHSPLVLTQGLTAKEIKITNADSQILESRKWQVIDIARAFGVPAFMIGETEKTSSWGSGIEQMTLGFVKFSIAPHVNRWSQEINRKLFRRTGTVCAFDYDELQRGDSKSRGEFFQRALGGASGPGWMTQDEVRLRDRMKPKGGAADKLYQPGAAAPKKESGNGTTEPADGNDPGADGAGGDDPGNAAEGGGSS